jgi:hypothetical protein
LGSTPQAVPIAHNSKQSGAPPESGNSPESAIHHGLLIADDSPTSRAKKSPSPGEVSWAELIANCPGLAQFVPEGVTVKPSSSTAGKSFCAPEEEDRRWRKAPAAYAQAGAPEAAAPIGLVYRVIKEPIVLAQPKIERVSCRPERVRIEQWAKDCKVSASRKVKMEPPEHKRDRIAQLSARSAARLKFLSRNASTYEREIGLTYPDSFPLDGRLVKYHLKKMVKALVNQWGLSGFWVLEFQDRGAPHLHILVGKFGRCPERSEHATWSGSSQWRRGRIPDWLKGAPPEYVDLIRQSDFADFFKLWLSSAWPNIVDSKDPAHYRAGTHVKTLHMPCAAAVYVSCYMSKKHQKQVPDEYRGVGRFWAFFGGGRPEKMSEIEGTPEDLAPTVRILKRASAAVLRSSVSRKSPKKRYKQRIRRGSFTAHGASGVFSRIVPKETV